MSGKLNKLKFALAGGLMFTVTSISAQTVKGTVTDNTGEPIIGASVMEVGQASNGGVTDIDGNFTVNLKGKSNKLKISYIGMKSKEVSVAGKSVISIKLEDDDHTLNDVVVIGYGTVRKKDLTGSVSSISDKQIANIPVSNVSEAMTGKMAGVNITTTEGSPDADVKIRVRGGGSLSQDNSPLYIVDGFPVSSISDIAPSEIQSIDVLKDASSTAIYGARGANGVIIVTTKSGSEGKTQVNFNASYGWKKSVKDIKVLNPYEYVLYQYEIASAQNNPYKLGGTNYGNYWDYDIYKSIDGTNHQDEVFGRTGTQAIYNANVSGGSKDFKYNISYSHNQENSVMQKSGYNKDNIGAKLQAKLNKWLTFDFNGRMAYQKVKGLSGGADTNESNAANSIVAQTITFAPLKELTVSDEDEENSQSSRRSPMERLEGTYKLQTRFQQNYNASLTWKPFKHWTAKTEFGYGWKYYDTDQAWTASTVTSSKFGYNGRPQAYFVRDTYKSWRNANTLTYDKDKLFGGRDHLNVLIGHEWSSDQQTERTSTSVNFPVDFTLDEILSYTNTAETTLGNTSEIKANENMLSFFGRVNYTLADKYLMTFTLREDGSSKFASNNRWGLFPSLALAWRLSDEKFMKSSEKWLSNLKLRLSYGTAGNNRIPSDMLSPSFAIADNTGKHPGFISGGTEVNTGMLEIAKKNSKTVLYNSNLKWETTTTRNFGIDFGFLRGRISGTLDFYWNTTNDLLMLQTLPSATGYERQYQNVGSTSNKGIEFATNIVLADSKKFNMNFNFNISYNKNKIDKLEGGAHYETSSWGGSKVSKSSGDFLLEEGGRLGELWGYKSNGFYTVFDPATGKGDLVLNSNNTWRLATAADGHIGGYNSDGTPIYTDVKNNSYSLFGGSLYPGAAKVECDENGEVAYQRLGNTVPTVTGGFGFDGMWKTKIGNFDFNIFCNYSLGNKVYNATAQGASFYSGSSAGWNITNDYNLANRYTWVDPATGLNLGRPSASTVTAYGSTDAVMSRLNELNANAKVWNPAANTSMVVLDTFLEDASFLRINNITVGYTLPKNWVKSAWLESVRIYFTAYNVYCFTNYSGYDPEVDTSSKGNPMTPGIDYAAYPKSRSFVAGINVTF